MILLAYIPAPFRKRKPRASGDDPRIYKQWRDKAM